MVFNWQKYQKAIENEFTIINKKKQEIPFNLNKAQVDIISQLADLNVILKARKLGFSSLMLAIGAIKFLFGENERCVSMSFDSSSSAKQLQRAKHFIKSFELKNNTQLKMKYNSKTEMMLEGMGKNGRPYVNTLSVGTAKSKSFGRGDDITFLHLTEVAFCDDLSALLTGVSEAVVDDAIVVFETTANGFNEFKDFWNEAELGTNGFKAHFYNPSWEYSPEFLEGKKQKLGRMFPQEYPMTPIEAFIASGQNYFDKEALNYYLESIKNVVPLS